MANNRSRFAPVVVAAACLSLTVVGLFSFSALGVDLFDDPRTFLGTAGIEGTGALQGAEHQHAQALVDVAVGREARRGGGHGDGIRALGSRLGEGGREASHRGIHQATVLTMDGSVPAAGRAK